MNLLTPITQEDVYRIPNLDIGVAYGFLGFTTCLLCGHSSKVPFQQCPRCGFFVPKPVLSPDARDPRGKRPDEWAVAKGHLVLREVEDDSGIRELRMDPAYIPFAFYECASRRKWPNPRQNPFYRISEASYDKAMASGPYPDPMPIVVEQGLKDLKFVPTMTVKRPIPSPGEPLVGLKKSCPGKRERSGNRRRPRSPGG